MKTAEIDEIERHAITDDKTGGLGVFELDPLQDSRWHDFIAKDSRACAFHSLGWLQALKKTYGYEPVVYSSGEPGTALRNGVVFCRVNSWLTGRRLVSLPFSDHCEPLSESAESLPSRLSVALSDLGRGNYKYVELRPLGSDYNSLAGNFPETYFLHVLDLNPAIDVLYKNLHVDSIRRKIQKAEREHLTVETGSSENLLREFYELHVGTRQKQQLPPHHAKASAFA